MDGVLLAHAASIWFLAGLSWTVGLVNYPLMAVVGPERFPAYEAGHAPRMAVAVGPAWAVQGLTTGWLLLAPPAGVAGWLPWLGAVCAAIPVVVTLTVSVPAHARLAGGFDAAVHRRLTRTHTLRTAGWTAHGLIALALLATA